MAFLTLTNFHCNVLQCRAITIVTFLQFHNCLISLAKQKETTLMAAKRVNISDPKADFFESKQEIGYELEIFKEKQRYAVTSVNVTNQRPQAESLIHGIYVCEHKLSDKSKPEFGSQLRLGVIAEKNKENIEGFDLF
ncbi:Uncharacterized protein Rs2_47199 [Raphanus sativus]|nr:Uncharacterized protein Rs2_47199 [Raphanus sativus]